MVNMDALFAVIWILFFILVSPVFFVAFDFWSGIRKSKQRGIQITSDGWRRTLAKLARYYNVLLALVIVDVLQMLGVWYMDNYYSHVIPIFPFLTLTGAVVVGLIEIKSIFEKAEDKEKRDMREAMAIGAEIAKNINNPAEIAKQVAEFLKIENEKKGDKSNENQKTD